MLLRRSARRMLALRALSTLLIVCLLATTLAPVASAQDGAPGGGDGGGGSLYLPFVNGGVGDGEDGGGPAGPLAVYRTDITVQTPAQWQTLRRIGPVMLAQGDNWAQVLVDDEQLADLARLRFNPDMTNALATLQAVAAESEAPLPEAVAALAGEVRAAAGLNAADSGAVAAARTALRSQMAALGAADLAAVAAAAGADADGDGLTDDQEGFWCTSLSSQDSDGDGTKDGAEVTNLKQWMNNLRYTFPSTGKPFIGWPPQKAGCYDDDQDSVPDLAELNELGLSPSRESTDRDKFDDGQELFGLTYCTGQGGYCSYGPLPRNEDWGIIFAEMPSWVKAPGNHPNLAAYPVPEIDLVSSSVKVEVVSVVTTDKTISTGTQKSYSTAKTEGTSTSVADTVTWNEWQETSVATTDAARVTSSSLDPQFDGEEDIVYPAGAKWDIAKFSVAAGLALCVVATLGGCAIPAAIGGAAVALGDIIVNYKEAQAEQQERDKLNQEIEQLKIQQSTCSSSCSSNIGQTANSDQQATYGRPVTESQDQSRGASTNVGLSTESRAYVEKYYQLAYPQKFVPTVTQTSTQGRSSGGALTTTNTQYEEHTVTNSEAFSSEESWGTATAVDSSHAADLWFTYKVSNVGTEYAREITNLAFNVYIGADPNPAYTYFVATDVGPTGKFVNFTPGEEHTYLSRRIPLTLNQLKAIDLGGPIRVVVEDFSYGIDELFYQDASKAGIMFLMEDGRLDDDESTESYMIPTWGSETVLDALGRYFPHDNADGIVTAIWTPEYRSDTPAWCQSPRRPTDLANATKVVWCKHTLSTAEWWNVYTDGLGDGSDGFQDTQAVPGAMALFRFNQDSDLDGFSDRTEDRMGTNADDATSFPHPELLGGLHSIRAGSKVTSTLSLLNRGVYDAYGVEAVMIAPDDSITIDNNTVGGSGRVRALKQVIVGSRVLLQSPLPAPWLQANHAVPAAAGYFTGTADALYTFTVANCPAGGCQVGAGNWTLNWSGGGGAGASTLAQATSRPPSCRWRRG